MLLSLTILQSIMTPSRAFISLISGYLLTFLLLVQPSSSAEPYLLFANRRYVRRMNLDGSELTDLFHSNDSSAVGLDFDIRKGKMYWSDTVSRQLVEANINGSGVRVLLQQIDGQTEGVAWDWITGKLYWTDLLRHKIEVMDPATGYRKVLLDLEPTSVPRIIILDPVRRWFYWSEWDGSNPGAGRIMKASMDGQRSQVLFDNSTVEWPNAMTLDYSMETLYWIDARKDVVSMSRTDGSGHRVIQQLVNETITRAHAYGIEFFRDELYWGEWFEDTVYRLTSGAPEGSVVAVRDVRTDPGGIHVVNLERQPLGTNPCADNNGGCSHLCLLSATERAGYSCVCPDNVNPERCFGPTTPTDNSSTPSAGCTAESCQNGGTCVLQDGKPACECTEEYDGPNCELPNPAGQRENDFTVSGTVFLAVTGALLAVILILTFMIAAIVFASVKSRYYRENKNNNCKRHSIAGLSDASPRDSPTHVVVGRLSEHDYISIKSRESPAPRGIVINIENLGGRSTPNQYTIQKGTSLPSNLLQMQNGGGQVPTISESSTLPLSGSSHQHMMDMGSRLTLDSDNESEYNNLEPRVQEV